VFGRKELAQQLIEKILKIKISQIVNFPKSYTKVAFRS